MAKRKRKVIKLVPATTANLTTGVINWIREASQVAERIHNGAVWDPRFNAFRKKRDDDGAITDVLACIVGRYVAIEIKNSATNDTPSDKQIQFREDVLAAGGIHIWGRDLDQIKAELTTYFPNVFTHEHHLKTVSTGGGDSSIQQLEAEKQKRNAPADHRRRKNRNILRHNKEVPSERSARDGDRTPGGADQSGME